MKKTLYIPSSIILLLSLAPQAQAGGYQIFERNAQGLGRAFAGEAAIARDASTIGSNPAGMSRLLRPSFSVSAATVDVQLHVDVEQAGMVVPALQAFGVNTIPARGQTYSNDVAPEYPIIPAAYAALPLNEQFVIGLGVFSNFSSQTNYESDFIGSLMAETSEITTINVNPSVSYTFNEKLAFGFGFNAVHAEARLSSANPAVGPLRLGNANLLNPATGEVIIAPTGGTLGSSQIRGDDWAYGWNAGVLLEAQPGTRVGLAYRSPVMVRLEGEATFSNTPQVDAFKDFAGYAPLTLPAIISLSAVHALGAGFGISADLTQTRWSTFDDLTVYREEGNIPSSRVQEDWQDANRYAVGLDYLATPALELRGGYALDETPISNQHRTLRIPTGDMRWYTLGASYKVSETISLDAGWAHLRMARTGINDERTFLGQPFAARLTGSAKVEGNIFATQLNIVM